MSGEVFNAFTRSAGASVGNAAPVNTAQIAPLRASLKETTSGLTLSLSPMRAADAVDVIASFSPRLAAATLVFEVDQLNFLERGQRVSLASVCERLEITPIEQFDNGCIALDDASLKQLLTVMQTSRLRLVRVDGPIEALDARAIVTAVQHGGSPLDAEFRAAASMLIEADSTITIEIREKSHAAMLIAENLRQYLAAMVGRKSSTFSVPFHWQVERLIDCTGALLVRPIETEAFSGSVDIGVCTSTDENAGPAAMSIIYDIPSDTWHDEP